MPSLFNVNIPSAFILFNARNDERHSEILVNLAYNNYKFESNFEI